MPGPARKAAPAAQASDRGYQAELAEPQEAVAVKSADREG
jgi:hypothetical protein